VCAVKLLGRGFSDLEVQFASNVSIWSVVQLSIR
jgi:hypothetical protein